jgi:hypothetical protein
MARTTVMVALLAALTLLCLSKVVLAAAPYPVAGPCATQLCNQQSGCGTTTAKTVVLPVATLAAGATVAAPVSVTRAPVDVGIPASPPPQFRPLTPRSPPFV